MEHVTQQLSLSRAFRAFTFQVKSILVNEGTSFATEVLDGGPPGNFDHFLRPARPLIEMNSFPGRSAKSPMPYSRESSNDPGPGTTVWGTIRSRPILYYYSPAPTRVRFSLMAPQERFELNTYAACNSMHFRMDKPNQIQSLVSFEIV
ncbi:hypothetical protein HPP92_006947 [Vanilla planifolia]|uniref:Uncharacterized protein n=1 Tax=Vanilla planifolia TaxID=51239 RepID=A0A835RFC2_VANPL|nr:hypothetical protein HPP92_006947 [Vanilla planifolia]